MTVARIERTCFLAASRLVSFVGVVLLCMCDVCILYDGGSNRTHMLPCSPSSGKLGAYATPLAFEFAGQEIQPSQVKFPFK